MTYQLPGDTTNCLENALCLWMAENLGSDFFIQLSGYIGKKKIEISARIAAELKLIDKPDSQLIFTDLIFQIRIGLDDPGLRLECRLKYISSKLSQKPLFFFGEKNITFLQFKLLRLLKDVIGKMSMIFEITISSFTLI